MGASFGRGGNDAILAEINVTPLVDVVLVLLVVLMVAATAIASRSIAVELPKAATGEAAAKEAPLVVTLDERGAMQIDGRAATEAEVRARAEATARGKSDASAVLAADGRARHESVVRALDLLRGARIARIALVVRAEAAAP
jgi:biopolymer transport protein ExbD